MRRKETNPFYNTRAWKRKREAILRRDDYKDQLEKRLGLNVNADTVHHIFPIETYPEYKNAAWNLISVSRQTHEELHNRQTGELSEAGKKLLLETAAAQGIKLSEVVLVCGMPRTGKTTWTKRNLGQGLAYDLDYISAAFRLEVTTTDHEGARRMANAMVRAFAENAKRYTRRVFIIRTAPTQEELEAIDPDRVVLFGGEGKGLPEARMEELRQRIKAMEDFCQANRIPTEYPPPFSYLP